VTVNEGAELVSRPALRRVFEQRLAEVERTGRGEMLALRGRRQVGKSTAVERFAVASGVPYVYTTGLFDATPAQRLSAAFGAFAESATPLPGTDTLGTGAGSWEDWLGRIALAAQHGPVIAVLDEFPWTAAGEPALEGQLQVRWDRVLEKLPVLMILIGSDISMMERLSEHGRPLFGRLRPVIVPALDPAEVASALPGWDAAGVFDAYLVTGGYPRLVTDLRKSGHGSVAGYVHDALADQFSPLVATARLTLDAEFPGPQAASQVLAAIGADDTANPAFGDVLSVLATADERAAAQTALSRSLRVLTEAKGLVEREQPAWAGPKGRLRRYRVADPYLRFWFRYIDGQVDHIARGRDDLATARFDRDWRSWRGRSIEPVVRTALDRLARSDARLAGVEEIAPWWTRDGSVEVDVVAMTAQATALLGSIKWRPDGTITDHDMRALAGARARVPRSETAKLAAISPAGTCPDGADVAFSAADLLEAWR
jgi:AAA+ ATPase superfamily predicted ATPase